MYPGTVPGHSLEAHPSKRTGQARPGTRTEGPVWLPTKAEIASLGSDGAEPEATPPEARNGAAPPQMAKRVHDGPSPDAPDVQHFYSRYSQGAKPQTNAREAAAADHPNGSPATSPARRWPESKTRRQEIIRLGAEGLTYRQIAAKTGKSTATISGILRRRTARP